MDKNLDPWTKEFEDEFKRKPYYDRDEELPVEPLIIYEEVNHGEEKRRKRIDS